MFTGIVEGQGTIVSAEPDAAGRTLVVAVPPLLDDGSCRLGDSVALNGCCLTVVALKGDRWTFQAGAETLSKTNLGEFAAGSRVNLERALAANGRFGGHIVQGHVDGVGTVATLQRDGEWLTIWFRAPRALVEQMVPKGSITIDGVSLTLVDVDTERFSVALIPHTLEVTTLGARQPGDCVNLEVDILGKYVRKFFENWQNRPAP